MLVTIRLFGRLHDLAGARDLQREVAENATAAQVWEALTREFPGMEPYRRSVSVAVNVAFAKMTTPLAPGDDVAFLPPVSGG
jgi:molybdopterin synthase sulfur carrier subunit